MLFVIILELMKKVKENSIECLIAISSNEMRDLFLDLKFNEFCEKNKDFLLKENPLAFIQFQVDYYALKDDFFKTLEVVNYYKNAPYISMEVEDFLNE